MGVLFNKRSVGSALVGIAFFLLLISGETFAAGGRADYDLDDDGLIEIDDLADLDEIRNNLDGSTLYSENTGCPSDGCEGFELTTDLDFDTNGDGVMDADDDYWNDGEGWEPVGDSSDEFTAIFDGNGYTIANLYIDRSSANDVGFFGDAQNAELKDIALTGGLMSVTGNKYVGALMGSGDSVDIIASYATGSVQGSSYVGGLVGSANFSSVTACFYSGDVYASTNAAGGLAGYSHDYTKFIANFVSGSVRSDGYAAGLVCHTANLTFKANYIVATIDGSSGSDALINVDVGSNANTFTDNYWAETTGIDGGYSLLELMCPTAEDNTDCADDSSTLYNNWWNYTDDDGNAYWDFGTDEQLPGLYLNGVVYRDSDGDGMLDGTDDYPYDYDNDGYTDADETAAGSDPLDAVSLPTDSDGDYVSDATDAFPEDPTETVDTDSDGVGDNSDAFPDDPTETTDSDSDGVGDNSDYFPNDATGSTAADDVDADDDGLIEIDSPADLDAMRDDLAGTSLYGVTAGCPDGGCIGYELTKDIDFDTNGDSVMDDSDDYWNDGEGWEPIGKGAARFACTLEGNGYEIRNLYIDRDENYVGLFGYISGATIQNVRLTGDLSSITATESFIGPLVGFADNSNVSGCSAAIVVSGTGASNIGGLLGQIFNTIVTDTHAVGDVSGEESVGGLIGLASDSEVSESYATGDVTATSYSGALIGALADTEITAVFATGDITGANDLGGLIGYAATGSYAITASFATGSVICTESDGYDLGALVGYADEATIDASYATGTVDTEGTEAIGGLIGMSYQTALSHSHWATDTTGYDVAYGTDDSSTFTDNAGVLLPELQCPTAADNTTCTGGTLYSGWAAYVDDDGNDYWDFGTDEQLPGLYLNGIVYRDSDGDGLLDDDDDAPFDYDNDGYIDADEVVAGSDMLDASDTPADTDGDYIPDVLDDDIDGDGLSNTEETDTYGTDPADPDSDGDGISDGDEVNIYNTDPMVSDADAHETDTTSADSGTDSEVADDSGGGGCFISILLMS